MLTVLCLVGGLVLLVGGAEFLVRGAVRLATLAGISPLVIGLTVVAFGTSAPEMAVCVKASLAGSGGIALGDVVGANLLNILVILGISAVIGPLIVDRQLIKVDVPVMIAASLALWIIALGGVVRPWHGALFVLGIVAYTVSIVRMSRREMLVMVRKEENDEVKSLAGAKKGLQWNILYISFVPLGFLMLIGGSELLVKGAVEVARIFGVSEVVIGLTVVALGTTSPEMTTSVMASLRGHRDIAVGNVVGSNIFNLMAVLGMAAFVSKQGIDVSGPVLTFDIPLMAAAAVICLPIFISGMTISRLEGVFFILCYIAYTSYRIATARHQGQVNMQWLVAGAVVPIAVVWTAILLLRAKAAPRGTEQMR